MDPRCLHFYTIGILLCIFLQPAWTQEVSEQKPDINLLFGGQQYDDFEWNLLKELDSPDFGNVLVSPLSLKMVLMMLYEGSSGSTQRELEQVLQLSTDKQTTREKYQQILTSLNTASASHVLDIGSRIFLDASVSPQQRFASLVKNFYDTDIQAVDFTDTTSACNKINYWVSNVTHGHVKDLVADSDVKQATLIMANALYYKGLWRMPFNRENTRTGGFYVTPQRSITVPFMFNEGQYYYADSKELDAKILRLPYESSSICVYVILPNSKSGLSRLIRDLNPQVLKRHIWLLDPHEVKVYLPRFSFTYSAKLGRILQKLGLQHIFQNTASLAGIARGKGVTKKLIVSNILQKSGIDVNEEGSTVYSATDVLVVNKFGRREEIFNASNPFMFYIEDEYTGSVLFMGKVENPAQTEEIPIGEELATPVRFRDPNPNPTPSSVSDATVAQSGTKSGVPMTSQR